MRNLSKNKTVKSNQGFLNDKSLLVFLFSIFVLLLFAFPGNVYSLYQGELTISRLGFIIKSVSLSVILALIVYGLFRKAPSHVKAGLFFIGSAIAVLTAYNFFFLDYGDKVVGADPDVFDGKYKLIEIIGIAVLTIFLGFVSIKFKSILSQGMAILAIAVAAPVLINIHKLTNGAQVASDQVSQDFYSFSPDKNIIHIVLDGMEAKLFEDVLENEPELRTGLQGFIAFPDTLTSSEISYLSFAAFLSGEPYDGSIGIREYLLSVGLDIPRDQEPVLTPPLFADIQAAQFDLDILVAPGSGIQNREVYRSFVTTEFKNEALAKRGFPKLLDLTLVRILPWALKDNIYAQGSWKFSRNASTALPRANGSAAFLSELESSITTANVNPSYKLIHLNTPHGPWTTSSDCGVIMDNNDQARVYNQARCALLALDDFLESIKARGLYERSMIVVHGDHGIAYQETPFNAANRGPNAPTYFGNANPLVLVKDFNAQGDLEMSSVRLQLTDMRMLFQAMLTDSLVSKMNELNQIPNRNRQFYAFQPNRVEAYKLNRFDVVKRFDVNGTMFDPSSWNMSMRDQSVNFSELDEAQVFEVKESGISGPGAWFVWADEKPNKSIYIQGSDGRIPVVWDKAHLTFLAPEGFPETPAYFVDPVAGTKQRAVITTQPVAALPETVDLDSYKAGEIVDIAKLGQSGPGIWVRWKTPPLNKNMFIIFGEEKRQIYLMDTHFTFRAPLEGNVEKIYLVDPDFMTKQEIVLPPSTKE